MMQRIGTLALALALAAPAGAQESQWPGVPEEQAAQVRAAGAVIDQASFSIFAPLVPAPPYADVTNTSDITYGSDPAQKLDVYTLNTASRDERRPVLLYVHGGGFVQGSKVGDYYPQSATAWAARNGMVGVNIDYRLAPAAQFPAARDDLATAIAWVRAHAAEFGADPDRIVLWGHSAGAVHVADYVQHTALQGPEAASVKGALLLSAVYLPEADTQPHPYYGSDASLQTAAPAIARLGASIIPLLVGWAEYDPEMFHTFAADVERQLCAEGSTLNCPTMLYLRDHNHMTEGASIGSVDESLSGPFLAWMAGL
jgi:acetyl esterase/lipase